MPLMLGATGEDILARRGTTEFIGHLKEALYEALAHLPPGDDLALLEELQGTLDEEIAFEDRFIASFATGLDRIDETAEMAVLTAEQRRLREMVAEYFRRRESVPAVQMLCTTVADRLTVAALRLAVGWMEEGGFGPPPACWCWLVAGRAGRMEMTPFSGCDAILVHEAEGEAAAWFVGFANRAAACLEQLGLAGSLGITPSAPLWRGTMEEWRKRIAARIAEGGSDLEWLMRLADLRYVTGDPTLAAGMVNLVRAMLSAQQAVLRDTGRRVGMLASGFDFFGRLRLERGGEHRGRLNVGLYGIMPLVANIRVLTVRHDIPETGTIARIRGLQRERHLDVALAERLLRACHTFGRLAVTAEMAQGSRADGGPYVIPDELSDSELQGLKMGLEAVAAIQRIVYVAFTGEA